MTSGESFKDALDHWPGLPTLERQFEPRLARAAAKRVRQRLAGVEPKAPRPHDLDALYRRIEKSWSQHRSLEHVHPHDLRRLPWVLFYTPAAGAGSQPGKSTARWLGAEPDLATAFGRWLGDRRRAVRALLHEFLRVYPAGLPTFDDWRQLLRAAIENCPAPVPPSISKRQRQCRDFGLVETDGDWSFVRKLVETGDDPDAILQRAGLDAGLARCGFLRAGIRRCLSEIGGRLAQNAADAAHLERLLRLLECDGRLRFGERDDRVAIATALLGPFADNGPAPPGTEGMLRSFFLRHFGHPHLPRDMGKWSGVPEEIRRVVMRWFVKLVLDRFFLLIRRTALDRHWRFREAFWHAFFRQNVIEDIWLLLGRNALRSLQNMPKQDRGGGSAPDFAFHGALHGTDGSQSVLLLRLPGVTVAEWSHNGKCRLWLDGTPSAPRLYRSKYSRYDLTRGEDFSKAHFGSENGSWQDAIARWLRKNTGLRIDRAEYVLNDAAQQRQDLEWDDKKQGAEWRTRLRSRRPGTE